MIGSKHPGTQVLDSSCLGAWRARLPGCLAALLPCCLALLAGWLAACLGAWSVVSHARRSGEVGGYRDILNISYYILHIDRLVVALDAHMLSHNGYGPEPGPISIMAAHMCIKGDQLAINRQSTTDNWYWGRSHSKA